MSEYNDDVPEEPMLFGIPLSLFPRVPPREKREPTLWELFKLGIWPPRVPVLPYGPPPKHGKARG